MTPRVSIAVRSYNRLAALCELIESLLAQEHDSFEIIVVDQSTEHPEAAVARLKELEADPRVKIIRREPLGGPRARNLCIENCRGEVVVNIDDDDLPMGKDFLTKIEQPFLDDVKCVGVTCRHFWKEDDRIGPFYRFYAWRRCMSFSPVTKVAYTYPRYDRYRRGVDWVHGTGGAFRRSVFERFGGWDEDTPIEDEYSLAIRMKRGLDPDEYLVFDPSAHLQRRMDLGGGLGKRRMTPAKFYAKFMTFVHHVMARYYPTRVRALYPLYAWAGYRWSVSWLWDDSPLTIPQQIWATIAFTATFPYHAIKMLSEPFGKPPGSGIEVKTRLLRPTP